MKIQELLSIVNELIRKTEDKIELKILQGFVKVLSDLENRTFTAAEISIIEAHLSTLNLKDLHGYRRKALRKELLRLNNFLKTEFSLTTKGYYTNLGMILGMSIGTGIGLTFGSIFGGAIGTSIGLSIGTGLGMAVGIGIGAKMDAEAKQANRVIG